MKEKHFVEWTDSWHKIASQTSKYNSDGSKQKSMAEHFRTGLRDSLFIFGIKLLVEFDFLYKQ